MHSIRVKITLITVAAILTTILSVFAACYGTFQTETDKRSVETMSLIGEDAQKSLEKYIESIEQSVEMAANIASDSLDSVFLVEHGAVGTHFDASERTPEMTAELDAYLAEHCAVVQEAFASVASNTQGVITYYYCISPEISENEHGFFYWKIGKTGFDEQRPLDARELDPEDIAHTTWYFSPIKRGRPCWVGPYTAHFLGEMVTYSYLVPIYKSGTLIGVLGMDVPFETLTSHIRSIKVYETGFACLIDSDGRVLYHPELEYGYQPDTSVLPILPSEMIEKKTSGNELLRYTKDGEKRQMYFTTMSNGMTLAIVAPVNEINASWLSLVHIVIIITGVMIITYSFILGVVMRVITLPLETLIDASKRLANADYNVMLEYNSRDEVGVLTSAFAAMRDKIREYIDDLSRRANTDALTGLANMRYFFTLAEAEHDRLVSEGKRPAVLYINLIGMKHFNRQYGFEEGDRLICSLAEILKARYGERRVSHLGQDHFAVITSEDSVEDGLQEVFRECSHANGGNTLPVRAGIYLDRRDGADVNTVCDRAKYACDKYSGSYVSGFCYFDEAMLRQVETDRYIINHLDQALEERWIKVYYQPIVRAANGRVCDEEALSRWIDPVKGMLSPIEFIPVLEKSRLIYKLDLYMLDRIIEHMQEKMREGIPVVPQSLNLSRVDFDACDIVEEIRRRVDDAGISRELITIEITESIVGSDFEFMKSQIQRFQALGFEVWMDDFGSGYSSLDVLQDIHFDLLKFDMRFMHRFGEGDESKIILTELIRMATSLNISTVCEGVETQEQVEFLRDAGCTKMQGYRFSKPIPFEAIVERSHGTPTYGFENPRESDYYEAIGKVDLFDFAITAGHGSAAENALQSIVPMAVLEINGDNVTFVRSNQPYRDFMLAEMGLDLSEGASEFPAYPFGAGAGFMKLVRRCCEAEGRGYFDEKLPDGTVIHSFVKRVSSNSVTGAVAAAVAVLSVTHPNEVIR